MFCSLRTTLACLLALTFTPPAFAQATWPDKPVKIVVGFTAGSSTDVTARMFAQKFSEAWGQPVIVENVAGNSGAIGVGQVQGHVGVGPGSQMPLAVQPQQLGGGRPRHDADFFEGVFAVEFGQMGPLLHERREGRQNGRAVFAVHQ